MKNYLKILSALLFLSLIGCNENSIEPVETIPGSRNYTWKNDILNLSGYYFLNQIWGSSANDVWSCGNDIMLHYDGTSWKEYQGMGGNLNCLYGFASNDVWTIASGTYNGVNIFHYNGNAWQNMGLYSFTSLDGFLWIGSICGDSPNNLYAVGVFDYRDYFDSKAVIMHYDGVNWKFVNIPQINCGFARICKDSRETGKYYIYGEKQVIDTINSTKDHTIFTDFIDKIYEFDGTNINEIYSNTNISRYISEANGKVYFIGEDKLWQYSNNQFSVLQDLSSFGYDIGTLHGRNEKDLFFHSMKNNSATWRKYITHYNGTNLESIYDNKDIWAFTVINNDVFVVATDDNNKWMISRGTLTNKP